MWGNNFGLPDMLVHSDENEYVSVVKSLVDYTPSPYKIGIPKSSFYYLLGSHYSFFRNFIHNSPVIEDYFLSGRSFSAILSTIVLFLWFLTVRNFFNFRLAIWSMLFLAVSLIDVQIAHYIKEDVYVQFFGVISLYFLSRSFRNGGFWNLVVSIIAAVLAGSAKISGFVYAIPIGLHLILFNEDKRALNIKNFVHFNKNRILVFFLITLASLAFYINTPISFMDSPASKKYSLDALLSPEHEVLVMSSNKDGLMNVVFWPVYLLTTGMGYFLFPMSVLGIGVLFKKRRLYAVKFASIWIMTALYYFILSVQTQRFDRWITLITPSLALLGAIAIEWLLTKFSKRFITCIVSIGLIWTIGLIGTLDWKLSQPDTRHFAVEQLKKLNENDILLFLPGLDPVKNEMAKSGSIVYDLDCPPAGAHRYAGMYFVKNDTLFDVYRRFKTSDYYQKQITCVDALVSQATLIAHFQDPTFSSTLLGPDRLIGPGTIRYLHSPQISLYKINKVKPQVYFLYSPEDMYKASKNMLFQNDHLSSVHKESSIGGPYIILPAGRYEIEVSYQYQLISKIVHNPIMTITAYSDALGFIGKSEVSAQNKSSNFPLKTKSFIDLPQPTQLQTRVNISGQNAVDIYYILIRSTDIHDQKI